ncbi:MAG: MATE family efflux transporter [Planctomycetia bacterium]|nr:MATE family efflux transporter [Planctomycetia bacterium]
MFLSALSMLPGTIAISGYNLADTYFVSQMNDWRELAAMGYSFPIVMFFSFIFSGFATGVMVSTSQAFGGKKRRKASHLITAGLVYSFILAIFLGLLGFYFMEETFLYLGAGNEVLPGIRKYMSIWYLGGAATAALGSTGNNIFMSVGSTRTAGIMMLGGLLLNIVLDPIFIFGYAGMPKMGIAGAAMATVIAQGLSALVMLGQLHFRYHFLTTSVFCNRLMTQTRRLILKFAFPAILGLLLIPLGNTIITAILARFSDKAVAAVSTAGRIELIAFVLPMSLGMALMPMIAQNYGAGLYSRIHQCRRVAMRAALILLVITGTLLFIFAESLARIFTQDETILPIMILYLRIVAPGFCMVEVHRFATFFYTGCGHPIISALLIALRIFGFLVPLSFLALSLEWLTGVFWARLTADLLAGSIALYLARRLTKKLQ